MIPETFAVGDSPIHSIDPRLKLVSALVYSFVVALSNSFVVLSTALAVSTALVMIAGLNAGEVFKRLAVLLGFVLLIWVLMPLTYPGAILFKVGPLGFSRPGVLLAARISLKSSAILLSLMALLATILLVTAVYFIYKALLNKRRLYHLIIARFPFVEVH